LQLEFEFGGDEERPLSQNVYSELWTYLKSILMICLHRLPG